MARTRLLVPALILGVGALAFWLWPSDEVDLEERPELRSSRERGSRTTYTGRERIGGGAHSPGTPPADRGLPLRSPSLPEAPVEDTAGDDGPGTVRVTVTGPGSTWAVVQGSCEDGGTLELPSGELCRIFAFREDGQLQARTELVDLELWPDETVELELALPDEAIGGLGVAFSEHDEGIQVMSVHPGSPAETFGLEAGDIIVEVDGLSTTALDQDEFIETMTGPVGSEVHFVVTWEGDTGRVFEELLLERAQLL
jgi:membrane-associated protease RseP (regulator of RpoE activity)